MKDSFWICFWLAMILFTQPPILDIRQPRAIEINGVRCIENQERTAISCDWSTRAEAE